MSGYAVFRLDSYWLLLAACKLKSERSAKGYVHAKSQLSDY